MEVWFGGCRVQAGAIVEDAFVFHLTFGNARGVLLNERRAGILASLQDKAAHSAAGQSCGKRTASGP